MPYGGARSGSGPKATPVRKGKPSRKEEQNEQFDVRASSALPELFDALYAIAVGHKVGVYELPRKQATTAMNTTEGATIYVYDVPPDKDALKYLVDRASGKAAVKNPERTETELTLEVTLSPPEEAE